MPNERHADDSMVQLAVAAAIAAAGPAGAGGKAWEDRVMANIPQVAAWMSEGARPFELAKQVAEAALFRAVYRGYEMEESSQRAVVQLVSDRGEVEHIRTNPVYRPHGASLVRKLDRVQSGAECLVWKVNEPMAGTKDRNVRVLVHLQVIKNAAPEDPPSSGSPTPAEQPGVEREPEVPDTPPAPPAPTPQEGDVRAAISANIRALAEAPRKRALAGMRAKGWQTAADVPDDMLDLALYMSLHEGQEPF